MFGLKKTAEINGMYFGSHPKYPEPIKNLFIKATENGIELMKYSEDWSHTLVERYWVRVYQ